MEIIRLQRLVFLGVLVLVNSAFCTPERIITLAPNLTEIVYALDAGDRLVARTRYCVYPPEVTKLPSVGGITDPSPEAILALKPDLVIIGRLTSLSVYKQLQRLNLPMLPLNEIGIQGVHNSIEKIAAALGVSSAGKELSSEIQSSFMRFQEIANSLPESKRPKTLLLTGASSYFAAGRSSFTGELLELIGAKNIVPDTPKPWPQLSVERIVSENPRIIIVSLAHDNNEIEIAKKRLLSWKQDPVWKKVDAVKNNRVFFVRENLLTIPGPRIGEAASILSKHIHGRP